MALGRRLPICCSIKRSSPSCSVLDVDGVPSELAFVRRRSLEMSLMGACSREKMEPKINDVVAYTGRRFDGSSVGVFTHRILDGDAVKGFTVKGDANPSPDVQKPTLADISGVVVFTIPFIGHFLTPKALLIFVPLIFGLWLVIDALRKDT